MCFILDLFQSLSSNAKWVAVLIIINSVFSLFYFPFIAILLAYLEESSNNWSGHWAWVSFGLAVLFWAIAMLTVTVIWCLCRNYAMKKDEAAAVELGLLNEKAKKMLGLSEKSSLVRQKKPEEIQVEKAEITPLPEYSPQARNSIFDFSEESLEKMETERSHSPFQDFLHLVQMDSPGTPEKKLLSPPFISQLNRISEEPMYDIPPKIEPSHGEENVGYDSKEEKPLVDETPEEKKLTKKKSQMFLGNIGKSSSIVSELFVELDKGSVIPESVAVTGRYEVLKS